MKRKLYWSFLVVLFFLVGGVFNVLSQTPGFTYYFPVVLKQATFTPTFTLTPTTTFTPTITFSPTFTFTPSLTATFTKTFTPSPSPTASKTGTATPVTSPPLWSRTAYINTDTAQGLYDLGCQAGTRDQNTAGVQDSVVVLDFGQPAKNSSGEFGTDLLGPLGFLRTSEIALRVTYYGRGYYDCSGSDNLSHMTIGIGTTNYGSTWLPLGTNSLDHGRAWASMVNDVNAWFIQNGYFGQVKAVGANDIELSWNSPTVTKAWVNGYNEMTTYDMYNYGAAEGCPTRTNPTANCALPWTLADVWYVSFGTTTAYPLPLIYRDDGYNARQWSWISRWSLLNKGYRMDFVGSFTQCQACLQRTGDLSCAYLDNKPAEGWQQLYNELIADGVSQGIRWSTDIFWLGDSSQVNPSLCDSSKSSLIGGTLEQRELTLTEALDSPSLSEDMRVNLMLKLYATKNLIIQQKNSAKSDKIKLTTFPKLGSPEFMPGIFEGDEGLFRPWQVQISNRWQGWDDETKVQVLVGKQSTDPQTGVVFVWSSNSVDNWQSFPAPSGVGELRILAVNGDRLVLQAEDGRTMLFSWKTGEYVTEGDRR